MNRIWRLIPLLLVLPAAALSAAPKGERMVSPPLPGFVVGHSENRRFKSTRVEIPVGETAGNWTRMVTTQWFGKLSKRLDPVEYADKMLEDLPKTCPDASASPVESMKLAGRKAARFKVVCPMTTSGYPESFVLLAIAGKRGMYVKQIAFKGKATSADFLWARKFLRGVELCRNGSTAPACQ
ncbi:MAG: hypothetical protein KUG65_08610 [Sphingomonadaceae bacterium]|nr:hypothetical protein [Sphingomonadaceae bacterium]